MLTKNVVNKFIKIDREREREEYNYLKIYLTKVGKTFLIEETFVNIHTYSLLAQ